MRRWLRRGDGCAQAVGTIALSSRHLTNEAQHPYPASTVSSAHLVVPLLAALTANSLAVGQTTVQVPLNYNFNGIVHAGEDGVPDAANGFRSISDRALDFTAGVPGNPVFARYQVVANAGVLDMVHLGNRNTVDGGNWAFNPSPNGNDVGVQPNWLSNVNQAGPQVTVLASPIAVGTSSTVSVLFHVSNGGGACTVTIGYTGGLSSTHTIAAPDWFGGSYAGRDSVDRANAGAGLSLTESILDISAQAGESMTQISFSNRSSSTAGYGIYAVNVEAAVEPTRRNQIPLACNWNGIVHAGEDLQPDAPNGFRSIADRALDFTAGVPVVPLLSEFAVVDAAGALDVVMLGNRNTVAAGAVAFDTVANGNDIGVQPSWLPQVDLTGPQTTTLAAPILLDTASSASFLYQMSNSGGVFDVTFELDIGPITVTLRGSDWVGGPFLGRGSVDRALAGLPLRIDSDVVDLGPLSGFVLNAITFSNFSNPNGSCAILAANVTGCLACANAGAVSNLGGGDGPTIATSSTGALGCALQWDLAGAAPNTPFGLWAIGFGATALPLATIFPACTSTLHVPSPITTAAAVNGLGAATLSLVPPVDPALCGGTLTAQFVEIVASPCPLLLSDALSITIGN